MIIQSSAKEYKVNIEKDFSFLKQFYEEKNRLFVIDRKVYELYKDKLFCDLREEDLFLVDALEDNKRLETALDICEVMTAIPAKRNAHMISIGGGIVQDITGFAANILYRGIHWTFVPTTLLAACDSCIGGKTSLNYKQYKNLLGTFFAPDQIYICSEFFKTLSEKDFESGLGEVVKFNVMFGEEGLSRIESNIDALLQRVPDKLDEFVMNSLQFKKRFIEVDEFDRGERIKLNFAHTFGHAFETMSNYEIPHGTAVAMGTVVANRISLSRGYMNQDMIERIEAVLKKIIHITYDLSRFDMDTIIDAIRKDKKQIDSNITAVLFDEKMELVIYHDVLKDEITEALQALFRLLG